MGIARQTPNSVKTKPIVTISNLQIEWSIHQSINWLIHWSTKAYWWNIQYSILKSILNQYWTLNIAIQKMCSIPQTTHLWEFVSQCGSRHARGNHLHTLLPAPTPLLIIGVLDIFQKRVGFILTNGFVAESGSNHLGHCMRLIHDHLPFVGTLLFHD